MYSNYNFFNILWFPETKAQEFNILNGPIPPAYRQITEAINIIRPPLKALAVQSALNEKQKIPINAIISVDGA